MHSPGREHHFPRTAPRGQRSYIRLLTRVDRDAPQGHQFAGQLVTPGAAFDPGDLPRPAVLLENAGRVRTAAARSRYSFQDLWILWRFDFDARKWIEVVRCHCEDLSWTLDFAHIAYRLLFPAGESPAEERARPLIDEISAGIEARLAEMNRDVRCYVVAGLDEYLAGAIVQALAEITVLKIGYGDKAVFPRIGAHPDVANPAVRRPRWG